MKQREESGNKWWDAAAAQKPLHFRIVDAVLFEGGVASLGLFTARTGELMRRTAASLHLGVVRGRMTTLAHGIFGVGGEGEGNGATPIAVAHLSDGSLREVPGGAIFQEIVTAAASTGGLRALTPWAAPLTQTSSAAATAAAKASGRSAKFTAQRLRNTYAVIAEGSQIGKVKTGTHRVTVKGGAVHTSLGTYTGGESGGAPPLDAASLQLSPSRSEALNRRLDVLTAQVVKLSEAAAATETALSKRVRISRMVLDFIVQPPAGSGDDEEGQASESEMTIWMERCVEVIDCIHSVHVVSFAERSKLLRLFSSYCRWNC
jgi:hypothetical protein